MNRSRFLTMLLIFTVWFSTTGFLPLPESQPSLPLAAAPASSSPAQVPGATLSKVSPPNTTQNVPASSVTLSWGSVQGYTGAVTYRYCLQTKQNCPKSKWVRVGTAQSVTVSNLTPDKRYYWWVRAYNSQNVLVAEANGGSWYFNTLPLPGSFVKTAPGQPTINVDTSGVQLTWSETSSNAAHYEYCVDTTNDNRCDPAVGWKQAPSGVVHTGLRLNTNYYWQVRAVNNSGATLANFGTWWTFRTSVVPGVFEKLSPVDNSPDQLINGQSLSWIISANAASYQYCINTSPTCAGAWQNVGNVTSTTLGTLTPDTDYYWQVQSVSSTGVTTDANGGVWWKFRTQPPLPGTFSKSAPANLAPNLYTDVTFTWQPSSGAAQYQFCLSTTNNDINCGDMPWDVVNGTWTTVYGLEVNTTYYWQVRAINYTGSTDANTSTWWSFTTQPNPPLDFTKSAPVDGAAQTNTSLTLTWAPSQTASAAYQVCYDTTDDDACDQDTWRAATTNSTYNLSGLTAGTTYYWQVRAFNAGGTTYGDYDMSAWWSFTTKLAPPSAFGKSTPQTNTATQPLNLTLSWGTSDPGVTYQYCLNTAGASCPSEQSWITASGNSASPTDLVYNATYYWQVRAKNSENTITEANNGTWWQFKTMLAPPTGFGKSEPQNGLSGQPLNPSLSWGVSDTGVTYQYCINTTGAACPSEQGWVTTTGPSANLTGLSYNTTYYWQVRAKNSEDTVTEANEGVWWTFKTMLAPPTGFGKSSPQLDAQNQSQTLALSWGTSDPDVTYEYCVSETSGECPAWESASGTIAHPAGLARETKYYWQVRAKNSEGTTTEADDGAWWYFTTLPYQPAAFNKADPDDGMPQAPRSLTLTWTPSSTPGASYAVCFVVFGTPCEADDWTPVTDPQNASFDVSGLEYGTQYYWQVRAANPGGTTYADGAENAGWSFTTLLAPPAAFNKSEPEYDAKIQPVNLTLTWTTSDLDATYEVCYDTIVNTTCDSTWEPVPEENGNAFGLTGLENGTTYLWQVRAKNREGTLTEANGGTWWTFKTMLPEPSPFGKTGPRDQATSQPPNPTLEWGGSDPGVTYQYCVSLTDGACDPTPGWVDTSETSAPLSGLAYDTTYYWQVRALNSENTAREANEGDWWSFTTYSQPPEGFVKTSPTNSASNRPLTLNLEWTDAGTGFSYEYCLSETVPFGCAEWETTTATSVQISDLSRGKNYYWQVRAKDSSGHLTPANGQDANPVWQFSTLPNPPSSANVDLPDIPEDQVVSGDLPGANAMTFALYGNQPAGDFRLSASGHFSYDPPQDLNGDVSFQFTVTDNINDPVGPYTVTIHYLSVNDAPVLTPIADIIVYSGETLAFSVVANDVDLLQGTQLTYSIEGLPDSATFDTATGAFRWMPAWVPGAANEVVIVLTVSDGVATQNPVQDTVKITILPRKTFIPIVSR